MPRRIAVLLLPVIACLAAAPSAHADATVARTSPETVTVTADGAIDVLAFSYAASTLTVTRMGGGLAPGASCAGGGVAVTCAAAANVTVVAVTLGAGNDTMTNGSTLPPTAAFNVDGGDDNDTLFGSAAADTLRGGAGDDTLFGRAGNDMLEGGDGDDTFLGESAAGADGADVIRGGAGLDLASYGLRTNPVTATIGAGADDGEAGEGDDVGDDVEDLTGGQADDVLTGDGDPNMLEGSGGKDKLTGNGGPDELRGGSGDDELLAQDGGFDRLVCGSGTDNGAADSVDVRSADCENVGFNDVAQPDRDGDGVTVAAGDCNDANGTIYAGAPDFFNNNVDEDCVGGDAKNPDVDGDGYLVPIDCNDRNAAIKPTAAEIFGNSIDENCDGRVERLQRFKIGLSNNWAVRSGRTGVNTLTVRGLPIETTVRIRCTGGGCPFKSKTRLVQGRNEPQLFAPMFRNRRVRTGARIEIRMSRPGGWVTLIERFTARRTVVPARKTTCIRPGETRERSC